MDWTSNKGKGKAKATTQLPSEISGDLEIKSLARKIVDSSSGLAKDFIAPSTREAISGLSSLGSEKARPSGSTSTATGESSLFKGSSFETRSRYQSNLNVLRRRDPSIVSIFDQFSHVCVYHHDGRKWEKQGFEGSMFLYERCV